MTACAFCGDDREPGHQAEDLRDGAPVVHTFVCQCCGAQSPYATSERAARELWNRRWPSGQIGRVAEVLLGGNR